MSVKTDKKQSQNPDINEMFPSDLLSEDETVLFALKPSLWSIAFLSFRTVLICSVITGSVLLIPTTVLPGIYGRYIIQFCGAVVLARIGFAFLQWVSRSYVLTSKRVIRIRGVFTIDIFQAALVRIQNTFLILSLPQRVFGLGSISFTTAGTGSVEAIWRHIKKPLKIHHQLLQALNQAANQSHPDNTSL